MHLSTLGNTSYFLSISGLVSAQIRERFLQAHLNKKAFHSHTHHSSLADIQVAQEEA